MTLSPVLVLVFNRPDVTLRLFEALRQMAPPKLYIVADGARTDVDGEKELCEEVKKIFENVDWKCEVIKLYRPTNMGCDPSIINGINWFFENEEQGIIFEDDCIPTKSFYNFCNQLLDAHKNNPEIAMISGTTYYDKPISKEYDYFISDFYFTWGWATWRHVWQAINWEKRYDLEEIRKKLMSTYFNFKNFVDIVYNNIEYAYRMPHPHWDNIFYTNNLFQNKKVIIPSLNQVNNVGTTGTHFQDSKSHLFNSKTFEIELAEDISKNYRYLSVKETHRLMKNYLKKYFPLTFKDRLYLIKMKLKKWFL